MINVAIAGEIKKTRLLIEHWTITEGEYVRIDPMPPQGIQPKLFQSWLVAQSSVSRLWQSYRTVSAQRRGAEAGESFWLDPEQCALLVVDCQPDVTGNLVEADQLIFQANQAIDVVRRHGGYIGFVRTAFDDLDYRFTPSTNMEFVAHARERRFENGSPAAEIHPGLSVQSDDFVVRKTRLGAFSTTDLNEQLTNMGVTTLIIAGAHTSGAVLSTVREAADRDYRLIVLSDCVADTDLRAHELLIEQILPRQAEICTVRGLDSGLANGGSQAPATMHRDTMSHCHRQFLPK